MKTILVTTDLSEESKVAFPVARQVATAFKAHVKVLAIIEDPAQAAMVYALDFPIFPEPDIQHQLANKVKVDLETLAKTHFTGLSYVCSVCEAKGPVHSEVINVAKESKCDLIILATHGRTGLSRFLIGSVTERVVRESTCPVLTVPAHLS